ncbi:MAG TPA: hypothetical protein VE201_08755 [Nitrospirales bacterium]|nr:hypothetical protein [Nitrospirales bacterium]
MRYFRTVVLTGALFALVGAVIGAPPAWAKEAYKDEAGRVIYTLDDDGIVSMFENSPTDLTISVTRGTREQMQPQITEVSPDGIPAGAPAVLRLKGKNLIGATVKMSVAEIEVGAYAGKPKALDLPIRVPATVLPGEVTLEVTTPIGSTKTSFKIKEFQIGGTGPSKRDDGAAQKLTTAAPTSCPPGMVGVGAERGGFCIEIDKTFSGDLRKAEKACAIAGKRLCSASEWQIACKEASAGIIPVKNMIGDWEWTGTQGIKAVEGQAADFSNTGTLMSVLLGKSDCKTVRDYEVWRTESIAGRCCK